MSLYPYMDSTALHTAVWQIENGPPNYDLMMKCYNAGITEHQLCQLMTNWANNTPLGTAVQEVLDPSNADVGHGFADAAAVIGGVAAMAATVGSPLGGVAASFGFAAAVFGAVADSPDAATDAFGAVNAAAATGY